MLPTFFLDWELLSMEKRLRALSHCFFPLQTTLEGDWRYWATLMCSPDQGPQSKGEGGKNGCSSTLCSCHQKQSDGVSRLSPALWEKPGADAAPMPFPDRNNPSLQKAWRAGEQRQLQARCLHCSLSWKDFQWWKSLRNFQHQNTYLTCIYSDSRRPFGFHHDT